MAKSDNTALLDDVDVEGIINGSLKKDLKTMLDERAPIDAIVGESYVATPKPFPQVTEFVSQKTKDAHVKLYNDYVETLNRVSAELDTADRGQANSNYSEFKSLKGAESRLLNAVWAHELFFSGFFDVHSEIYMDSMAYIEFERAWGTFDDWQQDLIAAAMSCGDGWAVTGYNMYLKQFVNTIIKGHDHDVMLGLFPIIVLDVHEHSYFKDYLTDRRSYVIAMLRQINWNVIEERVKKAKSIAEVLK